MEQFLERLKEDVLIVDQQGMIKFCNEKLRIKLEYDKTQISTLSLTDVVEHEWTAKQLLEGDQKDEKGYEFCLRTKYGRRISYQAKVTKGKWKKEEAFFIIYKEDEQGGHTKKELEEILNQLPFIINLKSKEGRYIYTNSSVHPWRVYEEKEILGKTDVEILGEEKGRGVAERDLSVMQSRIPRKTEHYIKTHTGKMRTLKSYQIPLYNEEKEVIGLIKIFENRTLSKQLEWQLGQGYEKLFKLGEKSDQEETLLKRDNGELRLQECILGELQADGVNLWVYDKEKERIVSNFRAGVCEELWNECLPQYIGVKSVKGGFIDEWIQGTHAIEKFVEPPHRDYLLQKGIRYMRTQLIESGEELLGLLNICYKEQYPVGTAVESAIGKLCGQLVNIIKQDKLAEELNREFKRRRTIEQELQHFLNTAADIMLVFDGKGRFKKVSNSFCEILGRSKEEIIGKANREFLHQKDVGLMQKLFDIYKLRDPHTKEISMRYINKEHKSIWIDARIKYLSDKDLFVCTGKNMTMQRELEEQGERYEHQIQLENIKNEFFSNISHEFKTPLNIILTTIQLMEDEVKAWGGEKYHKYMRQNAYRLLRLVDNLIDITKIESGYYQVQMNNYNIVEVVEDITLSVVEYIHQKGISLIFDTEIEEEIIACDPDKIERIMLNLLSNAMKYVGDEGEIWVTIHLGEDKVIVSVRDNGIGIPQDKLKSIFERYEQIKEPLARHSQGSGIGLSLVKALVEMHGGKIYAESERGKGTTIKFELPIVTVHEVDDEKNHTQQMMMNKIEKCHIEFADIYG